MKKLGLAKLVIAASAVAAPAFATSAGFIPNVIPRLKPTFSDKPVVVRGKISKTFFEDARREDVPKPVIHISIKLLAADIDFSRDLEHGDEFEFIFRGKELLFVSLNTAKAEHSYYGFSPGGSKAAYFTAKGRPPLPAFRSSPVDDAKISSGYGPRIHPTLKTQNYHRADDFSAPAGTPIVATHSGIVKSSGTKGAYGHFVSLKHEQGFETFYAHMKAIAPDASKDSAVRKGQVIGYVGVSGRSSGPHVHYEMRRHGRLINPLKLAQTLELPREYRVEFQDHRRRLDQMRYLQVTENLRP